MIRDLDYKQSSRDSNEHLFRMSVCQAVALLTTPQYQLLVLSDRTVVVTKYTLCDFSPFRYVDVCLGLWRMLCLQDVLPSLDMCPAMLVLLDVS